MQMPPPSLHPEKKARQDDTFQEAVKLQREKTQHANGNRAASVRLVGSVWAGVRCETDGAGAWRLCLRHLFVHGFFPFSSFRGSPRWCPVETCCLRRNQTGSVRAPVIGRERIRSSWVSKRQTILNILEGWQKSKFTPIYWHSRTSPRHKNIKLSWRQLCRQIDYFRDCRPPQEHKHDLIA